MPEIPGKPTCSTLATNQPEDMFLDEFFQNNNSAEQSTTTEQVPSSSNIDQDYSLRSLDLELLQPMKVNSELDYLNDDNPDSIDSSEDLFYDSDNDMSRTQNLTLVLELMFLSRIYLMCKQMRIQLKIQLALLSS